MNPSSGSTPAPSASTLSPESEPPLGTVPPPGADGGALLRAARGKVSRLEYLQMRAIRRTLEPGLLDSSLRFLQRTVGVFWITQATRNLHRVHYIERLAPLLPNKSFILVSNHRSFFDLYVLTATLLRWGMRQRIVFPVRSNFFYDTPAGFAVNGVMSFFAMYPPLFRDKRRAQLNALGLSELAGLLLAGQTLVGIHPEGRRNPGTDPYELLPAKSGVGRLIHAARGVPVVPVFTNGLLPNDLPRQITSNFDGTGVPIHSVFGAPIDFGALLAEPPSQRLFGRIAEACLVAVRQLGEEEKRLRALGAAAAP
ncbi:MAG TPA: lysophospholipid acyltransferase family protein [Polyangiaceae bacterium]|jgi:1-acyl-sn-glycerol-3-phosphate acyltransferase|nr:lysophospholipid acyltransferase family protein [Polyangiaceae bacterium]